MAACAAMTNMELMTQTQKLIGVSLEGSVG
jgi:hypothetical protein